MSSQPLLRLLRSRATQIRSFTQTTPFQAAAKSSTRKPPPAIPSYAAKPKTAPKVSPTPTKTPKQPATPPAVRTEYTPPQETRIQATAARLLGAADEMLLYKSPRNTALFVSSVIASGGIFYWVATMSHDAFYTVSMHWAAKSVFAVACVFSSALASGIMLAPHHLVRSISLARNAQKEVVMRVKGTRFFPFVKPATLDVVPGEMMVDSNVVMSLRQWNDVPLKNVQAWTEGSLPRPGGESQMNLIQRFNRRMVNIMPATFSQTRKMFYRDGMAYVRIGRENWKMDLEGCEILENGSVLMELVQQGAVRQDIMSVASRTIFAK